MSVTLPELQVKLDKLPTNLDRLDGIVNGPADGAGSEVAVDSGSVKTVARVIDEIETAAASAETALAAVTAEGEAQVLAVQGEGATQVSAVSDQGDTSVAAVVTQQGLSITAVEDQEALSITAVQGQQTTSVAAVVTQQGTSVTAVQSQQTTSVAAVAAQEATSIAAVEAQEALSITAVEGQETTSIAAVAAQEATSVAAVDAAGDAFEESLADYRYVTTINLQAAGGLPESLLGRTGLMWFNMLDGWDSDKQRVPNRLFPDNISDNRLFFTTGYSGSISGATSTFKAATGPGGETTAVLLSYANAAVCPIFGPLVLPADDWVATWKVKNSVSGSINYRVGKTNATTSYAAPVAIDETDWETITINFTTDGTSAYSYGIGNNSGSSQAVLHDEFQLYRADDGAPVSFASEVVDLSLMQDIRTPNSLNITPELLDVTATGQVFHAKMPSFPDHTTLDGATVFATLRSTSYTANRALILAGSDATQATHTSNGYNRFRFGPEYTTGNTRSFLKLIYPGGDYEAYMDMEAYSDKLQTVIATFDDTGANIFVDGYECGPSELVQALTAPLTEAFLKFFGSQNNSAVPPAAETVVSAKVAELGVAKGRISVARARLISDRMRANAAGAGLGIVDGPNVTFTEGDSITHGNPRETNSTPAHDLRSAVTPTEWVVPMGMAGSDLGTTADMGTDYLSLWGRQPRLLRNLERAFSQDRNVILIGQIGANDAGRLISSAATYYADLQAYWASLRAEFPDLIILWGDILPRQNAGTFALAATFNPARNTFNGLIAGAPGSGYINAVIPFGTEATMGPDAAPNDGTLYDAVDKLHPTRPLGASYLLASIKTVWEQYLV